MLEPRIDEVSGRSENELGVDVGLNRLDHRSSNTKSV